LDKPIKKKVVTPGRIVFVACTILVIALLAYALTASSGRFSGKQRLKVDPSRLTFSKVGQGEFREYYPFDGKVEPVTSVYLDVETGGRVDEIFVEGGKFVKKGDLILRFSNASLQRNSIDTESRLIDSLDVQRTTQFTREQSRLTNKETLLNLGYQISELELKFKRYKGMGENSGLVSQEEYQRVKNELEFRKNQKDLLDLRIKHEERLSEIQLEQANKSIERLNLSRELLSKTVESLDVRAPISGYLSSIEAEIGQNIGPGKRIGQIDLLDKLKLRADIDEFYLAKVSLGTRGKFSLGGNAYAVEVQKIYPEVKGNKFSVDMAFVGETPQGIKRGQTLTVELDFGETAKSLIVSKGGFYNQTGGRWVYLLSSDGLSASRANVRAGRQNPRDVEILEGLREGDWIITSGYDSFNEADTLAFDQPVQLR
jgi:HlyD family secretion protein